MNLVYTVIGLPIALVGIIIGFLARPLVVGFTRGFNFLAHQETNKQNQIVERLVQNDEKQGAILDSTQGSLPFDGTDDMGSDS